MIASIPSEADGGSHDSAIGVRMLCVSCCLMPSPKDFISIPTFRLGRDGAWQESCGIRCPLVEYDIWAVEVGCYCAVLDYLDRHQDRERFCFAEVHRDKTLVTVAQLGVGQSADGTVDSPTVNTVADSQGAACV